MAHTPTPWRVLTAMKDGEVSHYLLGVGDVDGGGITDSGFGLWRGDSEEALANAAFIVKAVNMHDELVSAIGKIDSIMRRNLTATNKLDKIAGILTDIDPVLAKAKEA